MPSHRATGDLHGIEFPADAATLLADGEGFLTRAFHASGALPAGNRVSEISQAEEFFGGGTGRKLVLRVAYASPAPDLPEELFIKFSRNFDDEVRDRGRFMMVSEARFATLSGSADFPVAVPRCLFADVEAQTGTGLLITERLQFGSDGLEAHYPKCMDYLVPEPLEHYKVILKAQARLAGTHRRGGLSPEFDRYFPYQPDLAAAAFAVHTPLEKLLKWAERMFDFVARYPQLFPENVRSPGLREQFIRDIPDVIAAADSVRALAMGNPDLIALCHWNANIDNCWFWRDGAGELHCGMLDWAMVGQMSVAQAISGVISGAESAIWDDQLGELLQVFVEEYAASGGPLVDAGELERLILLSLAVSGISFFMGAPVAIAREIGELEGVISYRDQCFQEHENARIQLHMMTRMLNTWQTRNLGDMVRQYGQAGDGGVKK